MNRFPVFLRLLLFSILSSAQMPCFSADIIIEYWNKEITRKSLSDALIHESKKYILNNSGNNEMELLSFDYDAYSKIKDLEVTVYQANGAMQRFGVKDFIDVPMYSDYTLFSDSRALFLRIPRINYPVTVQYEITKIDRGAIAFDKWSPAYGENIIVRSSVLTVITNDQLAVEFKTKDNRFTEEIKRDGKKVIYTYAATNLHSAIAEPLSSPDNSWGPTVWIKPAEFEYDGVEGSFKTWLDHGKWVYKISEGREKISEGSEQAVLEIVKKNGNDKKKIAAELYQWMQQRTRYVNISLGIGGWQPMPAKEVDEKGYGDCKALSYYMQSILAKAGIESYCAVIGVGNANIRFPEFASLGQANHVMLCVPFATDTTWLECTSQTLPFGVIGESSLDRWALLVKEEGGFLVKTPSKNAIPGKTTIHASAAVSETGTLEVHAVKSWSGDDMGEAKAFMELEKNDQRLEVLHLIPQKNAQLISYSFKNNPEKSAVELSFDFKLEKFINPKDVVMPINWNVFQKLTSPFTDTLRVNPVWFSSDESDSLHLEITLPEKLNWKSIPAPTEISSPCGTYTTHFIQKENTLIIDRTLDIFRGQYDPAGYRELYNFFESLARSEKGVSTIAQKK